MLWRKACERTSFGPKVSEAVVFVLRLNDMKCEKKINTNKIIMIIRLITDVNLSTVITPESQKC